ncbi:leucine--tRNA ligase [Candidatus Woesearchaeota archaeon]|nr:MAG: leucine--tRNA ligase [Candidatus Woesearchaeota archaeon]
MDFNEIEKKWQKRWELANVFEAKEESKKKKYYVLEMFPYPSGSGLHMGHARNYIIGDVYARFKRMTGWNVLYPMGYDALGLPAENAAIQAGKHPKIFTLNAIKNFIKQQKELGLSYDWNRLLKSCDVEYYKWNQYFFLKLYKKGLVYRKKAPVNWCPECNTVLANEQVHGGKCWRHTDVDVEIKHLEQWFIKTTAYADELLEDVEKLDWPERIKTMQRNWIGKSHGTDIYFKINNQNWRIFTTRADTIYGVTFMVISAQHPKLMELVSERQKKEVEAFLKRIKSTSEKDIEELEKDGVFTGSYAINPLTNEKVPVYAGNFVLAEYGSGMVMAVPAHDQRDFEFAKKYKIPIKVVIEPGEYSLNPEKMSRAYTGDGTLINSGEFNGLNNRDAIEEISKYLEKKKLGKRTVQYKLRDWLISRQRYWGTPIPFIYCEKCGLVPVPEKDLPVVLPDDVKFGEGNPLATNKDFVNTKCPACGGSAKRETDTMDTFFDSSWYFLRFTDNKNDKEPFSKKNVTYWMPVDTYIGGAEHACMHLIYARFFTKALRDLGYFKFDEPFTKLYNQGMLHGEDGHVMSKSRGNVVLPEEISKRFGIDAARFFLMFVAAPDKDVLWSDKGIQGSFRFVHKLISLFDKKKSTESDSLLDTKMHKTIREVTMKIENFQYNLALIDLMEFVKFLSDREKVTKKCLENLLLMLSPFCPHLCEELWEKLGNVEMAVTQNWPEYDEKKIDERAEAIEELVSGLRSNILDIQRLTKKKRLRKITLIIAKDWKSKLMKSIKKELEKIYDVGEIMKNILKNKDLKDHSKDIQKLLPKLVKKPGLIPRIVLAQTEEEAEINKRKDKLEKEFCCEIEVVREQDSKETKAKHAMPGKPAIIVE